MQFTVDSKYCSTNSKIVGDRGSDAVVLGGERPRRGHRRGRGGRRRGRRGGNLASITTVQLVQPRRRRWRHGRRWRWRALGYGSLSNVVINYRGVQQLKWLSNSPIHGEGKVATSMSQLRPGRVRPRPWRRQLIRRRLVLAARGKPPWNIPPHRSSLFVYITW